MFRRAFLSQLSAAPALFAVPQPARTLPRPSTGPAGIVAVTRAQERGYACLSIG
jgi:hypothetical protein